MRLHYVLRKHVSHVELRKERKSAVGIVPKGVTKHGKPTVKSIQLNSVAHRSHCVGVGDVILSVCGRDSSGMGKRDFKRLSSSTEVVQLELEYEIREPRLNTSGVYQLKRKSVHIKKTSGSFGFVLRKVGKKYSIASEYPILSTIAHETFSKDFSLRSGDRLVQIDNQDLSWLSLEEISDILAEKEEATFLIEYSVGIVEPCTRPGGRTELEMECLDYDIGIVLASSKNTSNLHIREIEKGSLAERCGVFQVGDTVLYINDISTSHLSISEANGLFKSFRKVPGKLTLVHNTQEEPSKDVNTHILDSSSFVKKDLHPVLSAVPSERLHLIPPQNSPESLYNWHFKRSHSKLPKTDRKSYDFQSKTISLLSDIVQKVTTLQELVNFRPNSKLDRFNCMQKIVDFFPEYHTSQKVPCRINQEIVDKFGNSKKNQLSDSESKDFVKIDASRLSQLEALCTETKDSARTVAMHFVKNTINVSLVKDSKVDGLSGDISYFTRNKIIHELTENLTEIHTKKLMPKQSMDRFLKNVRAVDFDCCDCYQLCLSAALTVQKVMLLLTLNDPDLDAMFVINTLLLSAVNVDVPCVDCNTPWCSVSEVGKESSSVKNEDKHSCDLLCHSRTIEADPLILSSTYKTDLLGSQDSRQLLLGSDLASSQDLPKCLGVRSHDSKKIGKRPEVNLNLEDRSAYYSLAQVESGQSSIASESDTVSSFRPKKMVINTRNISRNTNSCNTSQRSHAITEQLKVPDNSPNDFKVTKNEQKTARRTIVEGNYTQNCKEKNHVEKHLPTIPKQLWKSAEAITRYRENGLFGKLKSVITKHASDPTGFSKTPMDLFQNDNTSCRLKSLALGGNDCEQSQITSSNTTNANLLTDTLGRMKTCSSSMEVNLKNEGKGFGLEIEYLSYPRDGVTVTIIAEVEPNTAAANSGILLKGDRIVKINGETTIGLTLEEFSNLTKEAFSGDEVTLSVNFDVALPEVRFGTFDIHFDKILKPGLEFKDFSKGGPLIVRGVAKGSAAHRSGQLFAGDEILFTNCIRQEAFDSRKCAYTRTDMVLMTVRRERTEAESNPEPEENPPLPHSPSNSTTDACAVHRTSLHTITGSGALVLEQALTLCRDPGLGDFGFLVGKNLGTGGVYVTGIRPGGPADKSGVIKKNDRIVKIDGALVGNESSSLSLLLQARETLELTTRRMLTRQKI